MPSRFSIQIALHKTQIVLSASKAKPQSDRFIYKYTVKACFIYTKLYALHEQSSSNEYTVTYSRGCVDDDDDDDDDQHA